MQPLETIFVDGPTVACDGDGGVGGHPRVFLNLAAEGRIECPYCSRLFLRRTAGDGHGGASAAQPDGAAQSAPPAKP